MGLVGLTLHHRMTEPVSGRARVYTQMCRHPSARSIPARSTLQDARQGQLCWSAPVSGHGPRLSQAPGNCDGPSAPAAGTTLVRDSLTLRSSRTC